MAVPTLYAATPPTLISSCNPTVTITSSGDYLVTNDLTAAPHTDCIDIEAANVVLDIGGHTIKRAVLEAFGGGIQIFPAFGDLPPGIPGVQVINGTIIGFYNGMNTLESPGVVLQNLTIQGSAAAAMNVQQSDGAIVEGNNTSHNGSGIEVLFSNNTSIVKNTIEDNSAYGLVLDSPSSYANIVYNTIVDNGYIGMLIGTGTENLLSPPPSAAICSPTSFGMATHNTITRNKISNDRVGIYLPCGGAANNTIINNTVSRDSIIDLYDGTLGCDANLWIRNTGTRNQSCIH